jgi:hypothetical protein
MAIAVVGSTLAGLIVWLALGHRTPLWPLLVCAPLVAVVMLGRDQEMRDRLRRHRQGAEGEERVGLLLEKQLGGDYQVLHDRDMRHGNLDHFVVGPTGAFALETKAWKGRVWRGEDGRLMVGRHDREHAIKQVKHEAMWAHQLLSDSGLDSWVEAVIVLSHTTLPKGPIGRGPVRVVTLDELVPVIRAGQHPLSASDIVRGANAILRVGEPVEVRSMMYEP